jgi:hypothetical protein
MNADPVVLRPLLHEDIERLNGDQLLVLHRVALQLELEKVTAQLDDDFDADRAQGKLQQIPQLIQAARQALSLRSAS